jgi:hypothetical protein
MNVSSYIFQSPYPNQFQIGRPDPSVKESEAQQDAVDSMSKASTQPLQQKTEGYLAEAKTGASVNVAGSIVNSGVSSALEGFSAVNNQMQAVAAYNG